MADKKPAEGETPEPVKKGPIPPIVVKIAILVGLLVVTGVGVLFLVTEVVAPRLKGPVAEESVDGAEGDHASGEAKQEKGHEKKKEGGHGGDGAEESAMVSLGDLVVNPAGTGGRRYLKVQVALELSDPSESHSVEARAPQLRDRIIHELTSRTLSELTDPVAKDEMKETLLDELNHVLGDGSVQNLYFTEYVIQ
ncbi:MAG: flagellar basal body-associated FliL family protein [Candidatus Eisenbacteria bacterium]|uniref:Flagellar protein FliL n=1 Tax=Eiseniibacteriota bacterium TaxID=2212470 RepID=A0A956RS78_UNCEI|nr:flagellar basal body-associated FliL family protein [Candidatus Eisenbacteria bacterium]